MQFITTTRKVSILLITILILIIMVFTMGFYIHHLQTELSNLNNKVDNIKQDNIKQVAKTNKYQSLYWKQTLIYQSDVIQVGNRLTNLAKTVEATYYMDDIPLSKELQQYTYKMADKYNVDYSTALAVMKLESRFQIDAYNDDSNDYGLLQLNKKHGVPWANKITGEQIDRYNVYDNIKGGIAILSATNKYFNQHHYLDSNPFRMAIQAYNRGVCGAKKYYRENRDYHIYVDRIINFKKEFDKE